MELDLYKRYKNTRDFTWKIILQYKINTLPISIVPIIKDLNLTISTYKDSKNFIQKMNLTEKALSRDGFSYWANQKCYIFYNGAMIKPRIRFTLAHELGHILLKHNNQEYTKFEEKEANTFAVQLLAPACVIWALNLTEWEDIQKIFYLSKQASQIRAKRMQELYKRNMFLSHPLEKKVFEQFKPFIEEYKKHNKL